METMTKAEFKDYATKVIKEYTILFEDDEGDQTLYAQGSDTYIGNLANKVFDVEFAHLTISQGDDTLGGITLLTEFDHHQGCATVEIYNYSDSCSDVVAMASSAA